MDGDIRTHSHTHTHTHTHTHVGEMNQKYEGHSDCYSSCIRLTNAPQHERSQHVVGFVEHAIVHDALSEVECSVKGLSLGEDVRHQKVHECPPAVRMRVSQERERKRERERERERESKR